MAKVKIQGNASGTGVLTVTAPNTSTDRTITLPDDTGTLSVDKSITDNGNATAMTIGADENIGVGVVPEAWHSSGVALQVGAGGAVHAHTTDERIALISNAYESAADGNWYHNVSGLSGKINIDNGAINFQTAPTGSADSAVSWSTKAAIDSDGLKFNGDTAAANALDDYEEGTYQPTFTGSTSGSFNTTTYTYLAYTKIGRVVHIQGYLNIGSESSCVGNIVMSLPFTSASGLGGDSHNAAMTVSLRDHGGSGLDNITGTVSAAGMKFVSLNGSGADNTLDASDVDTAWNIRIGGSYIAA